MTVSALRKRTFRSVHLTRCPTSSALRARPVQRRGCESSEESISPDPSWSRQSNLLTWQKRLWCIDIVRYLLLLFLSLDRVCCTCRVVKLLLLLCSRSKPFSKLWLVSASHATPSDVKRPTWKLCTLERLEQLAFAPGCAYRMINASGAARCIAGASPRPRMLDVFLTHHSRSSLLCPTVKRSGRKSALRLIHRSRRSSLISALMRDRKLPSTPATRLFCARVGDEGSEGGREK